MWYVLLNSHTTPFLVYEGNSPPTTSPLIPPTTASSASSGKHLHLSVSQCHHLQMPNQLAGSPPTDAPPTVSTANSWWSIILQWMKSHVCKNQPWKGNCSSHHQQHLIVYVLAHDSRETCAANSYVSWCDDNNQHCDECNALFQTFKDCKEDCQTALTTVAPVAGWALMQIATKSLEGPHCCSNMKKAADKNT
jgi:hypothetical protein